MTTTCTTPDLSRVPAMLHLRLSDEVYWASAPWEARSPGDVAAGIRAAWALRIEAERPGEGHPLLALRRRLAEIDAWLSERSARPNASAEARQSWAAQAAHWWYQAKNTYGALATLHLQVQGPQGNWLGPWKYGAGPSGPRVSLEITGEEVERHHVWEHCRLAWAHAESLERFVDSLAGSMFRPDLCVVSSDKPDTSSARAAPPPSSGGRRSTRRRSRGAWPAIFI